MPVPRLDITVRNSDNLINHLSRFRSGSTSLPPGYQYFIAELVIIRLFAILEETIFELACKLVSGADYIKGSKPNRLFQANSVAGAKTAMLTHGRHKPKQYLNWTKVSDIKSNTSFVMDQSDPFISFAVIHGPSIDEMRKVRNFVAHRSPRARVGYRQVIRSTYGANPPVDAGVFLVTTNRWPTAKLDLYLNTTKIIIRELANG